MAPNLSKFQPRESSHALPHSKCPREIHILDIDNAAGLKFGQVPPGESLHSSNVDSMESDLNEGSFLYSLSTFAPRTPAIVVVRTSVVHDLCTDFTASNLVEYALTYVAPNLVRLENAISKQDSDITTLAARFDNLHAKRLHICNFLAKEGRDLIVFHQLHDVMS